MTTSGKIQKKPNHKTIFFFKRSRPPRFWFSFSAGSTIFFTPQATVALLFLPSPTPPVISHSQPLPLSLPKTNRTDPHFGSGHPPFGCSHSRPNRPAPLCTQTFFSSPSAKNITSRSPHNPSSPDRPPPNSALIFLWPLNHNSFFSLSVAGTRDELSGHPAPSSLRLSSSVSSSQRRGLQLLPPAAAAAAASPTGAEQSAFSLRWRLQIQPLLLHRDKRTPAAAPSFFPLSVDPAVPQLHHQICHRQKEQPPGGSRLQIQS